MNEEITLESIHELEKELKKYITSNDNDDETVSLIMYKVLLFSLSSKKYNTNILHNQCWKYFDKNKKKLINSIP